MSEKLDESYLLEEDLVRFAIKKYYARPRGIEFDVILY